MKRLITGLLASTLSCATLSNPLLNYTYIEGGLSKQKSKGNAGDTSLDAWYTEGSLRRGKVVFQAGYSHADVDKINGTNVKHLDVEIDSFSLFVGAVREFSDDLSLLIGISYTNENLDSKANDIDSKIYRFGGELRYLVAPRFELNTSLAYVHADIDNANTDDDGELSLGLRYHITNTTSVGLEYSRYIEESDTDVVSGNLRLQF